MSIERMVRSTLSVPLFYGLDPEQMSALLDKAERVTYQPGEHLIETGEFGDAAIFVVSGRATQFNPLSSLDPHDPVEPGALVGEMAMLVETQHHLTVVADEPMKAVKFTRAMIQAEMADDPSLADHFVRRIASRLSDLAVKMRALDSASQRQTAGPHASDSTSQTVAADHDAHRGAPTFPVN